MKKQAPINKKPKFLYKRKPLAQIAAAVVFSSIIPWVARADTQPTSLETTMQEIAENKNTAKPSDPFYATPKMFEFARNATRNQTNNYDKAKALFDAIIARGLTYDNPKGKLELICAPETFQLKKGQCMELTALYLALSRTVGLETVAIEIKYDVGEHHVHAGLKEGDKIIRIDLAGGPPLFDANHQGEKSVRQRTNLTDEQFKGLWIGQNGIYLANNQKKYEESISRFLEMLKLYPCSDGYSCLGNSYLSTNKLEEARTAFETALQLYSRQDDAITGLAALSLRKKDYPSAQRLAEKAISINQNNFYSFYILGTVYTNHHKDAHQALPYFKRAVQLAPENEDMQKHLKKIEDYLKSSQNQR